MTLPPHIRVIAQEALTAKQFEAWLLWEFEELGYGNIGHKLGISTSAARNRIHAALRNLEVAIESQGTAAHPIREPNGPELEAAA